MLLLISLNLLLVYKGTLRSPAKARVEATLQSLYMAASSSASSGGGGGGGSSYASELLRRQLLGKFVVPMHSL